MLNTKKASSTTIYIVSGLLLILIGILGMLGKFNHNLFPIENSQYRYLVKEVIETPTYLPEISIPLKITPPGEESASKMKSSILSIDEQFVHSSIRSELEQPKIPTRIVIPSIKLDAPVISAEYHYTDIEGETFGQWEAPNKFAAGWHPNSSLLGEDGNTVINGHHNIYGEVFKKLVDVKVGDLIYVYAGSEKFGFIVTNRMILAETYADTLTRLENAKWLGRSNDIRLTLVTCWPETSNTHRLILVARPEG